MKTLAKIFMAVVAGVLAFSCVTDTTEDLGVNLGEGQSTTLTLSLGDSRTYIGEYDGVQYPMYWSEGDQITVNGHTSLALTAEDINGNSATFTIPAVLEGDYCVTYPAAPAGQVKFVAEQTHKDNTTFGDGVATLYGYGSSEGVELKNLTGILKIGVTGSAKLTKAQISTTGNPIAGDFTIDFATGKVTPTSNATNVITYSFGDSGLQLTDAEQYMHIAVPAGEYNYLHITLFDSEGKVMVANTKADSTKPLTAGNMRIFGTPISYAPNTTDFYIADYNDLVKFANEGTDKDALVIANIDVPADATWTSIDGYAYTFNGNGYEISGLKAPLFKETTSTSVIKNVKLTNVNIESTEAVVGALVCRHLGAELSNCSASGSLKANLASATGYCAIGGVAGIIGPLDDTGTPATNIIAAVSNLTSYMSVEVDGDNSANAPKFFYIGGCTGVTNALTSSNLTNNGSITVKSTFKTGAADCRVGGVSGCLKSEAEAIVENTENYGNVTIDGTYGAILRVGGCAGQFTYTSNTTKLNGAKNDGIITISENISVTGLFECGGIAGVCAIKNIDETSKVVNEGDVVINGGTFNDVTYISGCYAWTDKVAYYATNNGNVDIKGGTYNGIVEVGGVLGHGSKAQKYLYNNGVLTISGGEFKNRLYVGGCLAWLNDKRTLTDFVNTGKIEINGTSADKMVTVDNMLMVGGCMGSYNHATGTGGSGARFSNKGAVEVGANTHLKNTLIVAGCLGRVNLDGSGTHCNYTNDAPITAKAIVTGGLTYIGGVIGYADATGNNNDLTNTDKGVITVEVNDEIADSEYGAFYIGGVAGHMQDGSVRLTNNGAINIKGTINRGMRLGGIIGNTNHYYRTDITNNGDITISAEISGSCRIGGIEGGGDCNGKVKKGHTNTGDIIVTETGWIKKVSTIGGIFGTWNGASDIIPHSDGTPSANYGDIIYKGKFGTEDMGEDSYLVIGGMFGSFGLMKTIQGGFTNSGSIEFSGTFYGAGSLNMGGIFGKNKVDLTTEGYLPDDGLLVFSGENIVCSGTIENGKLYIGGVAGSSTSKICNAKALSNIQAIGYNGGVGMITGSARVADTVVASNCAVGGSICTSMVGQGEDRRPNMFELSESNYFNYIYGSGKDTDWTGTDNYDGCTFEAMPTPAE